MKAIVIKIFRDKNTDKVQKIGDEIEVTKERLEEILAAKGGPYVKTDEKLGDDGKPK